MGAYQGRLEDSLNPSRDNGTETKAALKYRPNHVSGKEEGTREESISSTACPAQSSVT